MKNKKSILLRFEEYFAAALLVLIAILVFASAIARTIGKPINWAQDIALLAFGWLTFIGGDVICRQNRLVSIDMLTSKFPKRIQKYLSIIFDGLIIVFLGVLLYYGIILVSQSWTRMFNTLKLSYAWCTLAVPVGSGLMFTSFIKRLINDIKKPEAEWGRSY